MCYIVHMKTITLRELHIKTGLWVRRAGGGERLIITYRGRPVATVQPHVPGDGGTRFGERDILPEFAALPPCAGDSTTAVSEDRSRP
jgi:prevent-host-death family protein